MYSRGRRWYLASHTEHRSVVVVYIHGRGLVFIPLSATRERLLSSLLAVKQGALGSERNVARGGLCHTADRPSAASALSCCVFLQQRPCCVRRIRCGLGVFTTSRNPPPCEGRLGCRWTVFEDLILVAKECGRTERTQLCCVVLCPVLVFLIHGGGDVSISSSGCVVLPRWKKKGLQRRRRRRRASRLQNLPYPVSDVGLRCGFWSVWRRVCSVF